MDTHSFQIYSAAEGSGNLQRLDPVFILVIVCSCFCGTALMLLASVESLRTVLKTVPHKKLCIINGAVLIIMMLFLQPEMTAYVCNKYLWAVLNIVFIFLVPLMLILYRKSASKLRVSAAGGAAVTALIISAFIMSGCSTVQLSQRLIIQGIGIDYTDKYKLTMSVLDTGDTEKPNSSRLIYSEGESIEQAIEELEKQRGKKALFSQCLFIMLDNSSFERHIETLRYFTKRKDIRSNVSLMITEDTAENTIKTAVDEFGYDMEEINMLTDSKTIDSAAPKCSLMEYTSAVSQEKYSLRFPVVSVSRSTKALVVKKVKR